MLVHVVARSKARSPHAWLLAVAGADGVGLLVQAYTGYEGRATGQPSETLFWGSLCLIFGVTALAVALAEFRFVEYGLVVLMAGLSLQLSRLVLYPQLFVYHDELIHVRVLADILRTHHLFTLNTMLPTAPRYPGLEVLTACVANLTGLSAHVSSEVVLLLARVLMMLGLFSIVHRLSGSARAAAIACLVYMADPEFLEFDATYAYQTLALPLAFCFVGLTSRFDKAHPVRVYPALAIAALAVAMSHHLTSIALLAVLVAWWVAGRVMRKPVKHLPVAILLLTAAIGCWGYGARHVVLPYLKEIGNTSLQSLEQFFGGKSGHALFVASGGQETPAPARLALVLSVLILTAALLPALWSSRRFLAQRRVAAIVATAVALVYPLTAVGHLPAGTSQVADRATSFVYAPLGFVIASWLCLYDKPGARLSQAKRAMLAGLVAVVGTLVFFGGSVLGAGPPFYWAPGAYMAGADNRSIDRYTIATAEWFRSNALLNRRLFSDWVDGYVDSAIGGQQFLTASENGIVTATVSRLLLARPTPSDLVTTHQINLQFLVVDDRIANHVAAEAPYTDSGEFVPHTKTGAPTTAAITKFSGYVGSNTIYDNGPDRVYDVRGVG
jgi:hypothetical protein